MNVVLVVSGMLLVLAGVITLLLRSDEKPTMTAIAVIIVGVAGVAFPFTPFYRANKLTTSVLVVALVIGITLTLLAIGILLLRTTQLVPPMGGFPVPLIAVLALVGVAALAFPISQAATSGPGSATIAFSSPSPGALVPAGQRFLIAGQVQGLQAGASVWLLIGEATDVPGNLYFTSTGPVTEHDGGFSKDQVFAATAAGPKAAIAVLAGSICDQKLHAARDNPVHPDDYLYLGSLPTECVIVSRLPFTVTS